MAKLPTDTSAAALSAGLNAPVVEKDDFADAFANFSSPTPVEPPKPEPTAQAADGKVEGESTDEPATEIEGAPAAPQVGADGKELTAEELAAKAETDAKKAEEDAAAAVEAAKAAKGGSDDAITRLADMLAKRQEPTPPAPQPQRTQAPDLYTPAEVTSIQNFYKEWPEVAPAVEILLKGTATSVTNHIFTEIAKILGPKMTLLDQLADGFQYKEIKDTIPDYDDKMHSAVSAWVDKQPAYLKAAYSNVMQHGTVTEFNDLVGRYRQENGIAPPQAGNAPQPQGGAPAPAPTLSPAAKKAVAALAPVTSKRTGTVQVEPTTFEDAFEAFSKAG